MCLCVDDDNLLQAITEIKPFWGSAEPREWFTFMWFGAGIKCRDPHATARVWTVASARGKKRKGAGRADQREATKSARACLREEADAKVRA